MTPRQADLLTVLGLGGLLALVTFTAPRWAAALRAPATLVEGEEPVEAGTPVTAATAAPEAARRIHVRLYFEAAEQDGLLSEQREVAFSSDLAVQLRTVIEELARGPKTSGLLPTLPPGTRVLEVFVHAGGVAFVNLSSEAASGLAGGSRSELLTVYSLVNTIVTNFPVTSRVQILVGDQAVPSLAGHVDLSRPLPPDMTLVALPPPVAPASPRTPAVEGQPAPGVR